MTIVAETLDSFELLPDCGIYRWDIRVTIEPDADAFLARARPSIMKAGVMTTAARVVSQAVQLTIFLIAAHVMGPAQFGVFALVSAVAIIALRFAEAGWAEFVMSWNGAPEVPGQVLMVAIISGLVVATIGAGVSFAVMAAMESGDIGRLGLVFSLWIFLTTVSAVQNGLMVHQEKLIASAFALILGELAAFVVSVWALLEGYGLFALAYGRLAQQVVQVSVSLRVTRVPPRFGIERAVLHQLLQFSGHILMSRMISCIRVYAATFVIGGFLGPASVGYFRLGQRLVGAIAEVLGETARVLAWSMFRAARNQHGGSTQGFRTEARAFFPALLVLAVPVFLWIAVEAESLVIGLLGPSWQPAASVIFVLALSQCLLLPTYATEPLLSLTGHVRQMPLISLINALVAIALAVVTGPFGMMAVALGQAVAAAIALGTSLWLQQRHAGIGWGPILLSTLRAVPAMAVALLMLVLLRALARQAGVPPLVGIAIVIPPVALTYLGGLAFCYPEAAQKVVVALRQRLGRT